MIEVFKHFRHQICVCVCMGNFVGRHLIVELCVCMLAPLVGWIKYSYPLPLSQLILRNKYKGRLTCAIC